MPFAFHRQQTRNQGKGYETIPLLRRPLPCDVCRDENRPDFCIGTDAFHTPPGLLRATESAIRSHGYSVGINSPCSGSLVPAATYRRDPNVWSVMIEVNRKLYMDEKTGAEESGGAMPWSDQALPLSKGRYIVTLSRGQKTALRSYWRHKNERRGQGF